MGLWQEIVKLKYVKGVPISMIKHRQSDSPIWSDLLKIRHFYLKGRKYNVKNGKDISFWCHCWLDDNPICLQYPVLYDLCVHKEISVFEVASQGWVIQFKIIFPPFLRDLWYDLVAKLNNVHLED